MAHSVLSPPPGAPCQLSAPIRPSGWQMPLVWSLVLVAQINCSNSLSRNDLPHDPDRQLRPFSLKVLGTRYCPEDPLRPAEAGYQRLGVELQLTARHAMVAANPFYARLLDSRGSLYRARLNGCAPEMTPQLLRTGSSASGWMSFDIPEGAKELSLVYSPSGNHLPHWERWLSLPSSR